MSWRACGRFACRQSLKKSSSSSPSELTAYALLTRRANIEPFMEATEPGEGKDEDIEYSAQVSLPFAET